MRAALVLVLGGCSSILGINDPVPAGNTDDGGLIDGPPGPREQIGLTIAPDPLLLPVGGMTQLQAFAVFNDDTTEDVTAQTSFSLTAGDAITITPGGLVHALTEGGAVTIRADQPPFADTLDATVGGAAPSRVILSLGDITLRKQQRAQVKATIEFTDGSQLDGTTSVTWTSNADAVATVFNGRIDAQLQDGPATITATINNVSASLTATVGVIVCHPVINEVQSSGNSASEEWVEIYNPCTVPMDVNNWTLNYRAASDGAANNDRALMITLAGTMAPGELRLFGAEEAPTPNDGEWGAGMMARTDGAVGLRSGPTTTGTLVDSMAYGNVVGTHPFREGAATMQLDDDVSAQRRPFDGNDTDVNTGDFVLSTTTSPRQLNVP